MNKDNKEEYRIFGNELCALGRLITSYHSSWIHENGEYVYLKKDIRRNLRKIRKLINEILVVHVLSTRQRGAAT